MKTICGAVLILLYCGCFYKLQAQPVNDNPCGAISIPVVQTADPCTPTMYAMVNPTYLNLNLPDPGSCPGPVTLPNYPDYWFKFTAISTSVLLNFIAEQGTTTGGGIFGAGANYFVVYKATDCNGPFTLVQSCGRTDILYTRQLSGLQLSGVYYIRVVSALSNVATSNLGICASTNLPANTARVGINVNQPTANLDVAGTVLFRHDVNFQGRLNYYGAADFSQSGLPDSTYGKSTILRFSDLGGKKIILGNGLYLDNSYPGGTIGQAGFGVGFGTLQAQYPSVNAGGIAFGYGNGVSAFTQTALISGPGNFHANGSGNFAGNLTVSGNTGLGHTNPAARLSISTTGNPLNGGAMSGAFKVNAGNLGGSAGNELSIASLGFITGGNNTSLGIRGFRAYNGNDWTGTAILFGYDVDNTIRAAGAGNGFFSLNAAGNIGINTAYPTAPLSFPAVLGKKIVFYPGGVGEAHIGVFSNELRISSDYSAAKISFGYDNYNNGFTELAKVEKNGSYAMSIFGSLWANGVTYASDGRFKKNIEPLEDALDKVLQLQGVSYQMNTAEFTDQSFDESVQVGLIAQDVEKIVPEVVSTAPNGYKAIDYAKLVPLLIESIKTQQLRLDAQQKQIEKQQAEIIDLKKAIKKE
jgi:hypothetical protein